MTKLHFRNVASPKKLYVLLLLVIMMMTIMVTMMMLTVCWQSCYWSRCMRDGLHETSFTMQTNIFYANHSILWHTKHKSMNTKLCFVFVTKKQTISQAKLTRILLSLYKTTRVCMTQLRIVGLTSSYACNLSFNIEGKKKFRNQYNGKYIVSTYMFQQKTDACQ